MASEASSEGPSAVGTPSAESPAACPSGAPGGQVPVALRWSVALDLALAALPEEVSALLNEGATCVGYSAPARSFYLYVPRGDGSGWQVALDPSGESTPEERDALAAEGGVRASLDHLTDLAYESARLRKDALTFVVSGIAMTVGRDACRYWRCRRLVASSS